MRSKELLQKSRDVRGPEQEGNGEAMPQADYVPQIHTSKSQSQSLRMWLYLEMDFKAGAELLQGCEVGPGPAWPVPL